MSERQFVTEVPLCGTCGEPLTMRSVSEAGITTWYPHEHSCWLDAPTCEGWWWFRKYNSDELEIAKVFYDLGTGQLVATRSGVLREFMTADGRWFGPLTPPLAE